MRNAIVVGIVALATAGACAAKEGKKVTNKGAERASYRVIAYLLDERIADPVILERAKSLTGSMFAGIGIGLRWDAGMPPGAACPPRTDAAVVIRLATDTPAGFQPGAPAYALPYAPPSGERVTVFYDRAVIPIRANPNLAAVFLGHVLTHEIVHALQGVDWHSEVGLMKSHWALEDLRLMKFGPLPFSPKDVQLLQRALDRGSCGKTSAPLRASPRQDD